MEFVSARELRLDPKGVWKRIKRQSMGVVTINGQPSFLLTKLNPEELEEVIYIQNRIRTELAVMHMREQAAKKELNKLTPGEIDQIIRKVRGTKKK